MRNSNTDSYGRPLLAASVHTANVQKFLGMAEAAKESGDFEGFKHFLQQADRSNQLAEVMTAREAAE